jgi:hypothetical protein
LNRIRRKRIVVSKEAPMIDGLKLTMTGEEIRVVLEERIRAHERRAAQWKRDAERPNEERHPDAAWLPSEMCVDKAEEHLWRIEVLEFIREHVESLEVYRLAPHDLKFGELLPPRWNVQADEIRQG